MIVKVVYFPLKLYIFYSVLTQTRLLSIGKDVLAKARSGTGKTVAFLVSTLLNSKCSPPPPRIVMYNCVTFCFQPLKLSQNYHLPIVIKRGLPSVLL